jgi:uncharacterized protein
MGSLKARLESDLRQSMKARAELVTSTLRMALAAVRTVEVAGSQARDLTDDEVLGVLTKEAKKRREAADAFAAAGRTASAERERAEERVLLEYLPAQLSDGELASIVTEAVTAGGFAGLAQMGQAMKAVQATVAGRADGGRVAAEVRRQLAS